MNAFELYNENGKPVGIFACGKCRMLTIGGGMKNTRESAEQCCQPVLCECGAEVAQHRTACQPCINRKDAERTAKVLADAAEVEQWDGFVYLDGYGRDGFAEDIGVLTEEINDEEPEPRPQWAFLCVPEQQTICLETVIENLCADGYEEMSERLDTTELESAIAKFHADNAKELQVWRPDFKRKIRIPRLDQD